MTERKFVYANIRVPIEIIGESYEIQSDYMNIDFEICKELPEKTTSDNQSMIQKILSIHSIDFAEDDTVKIFASDFESKKVKVRQNSSFRGKKNRTQHYTRRKYQ